MILVTGGSGFIGTNLCLRLLSEGHKVLNMDIREPQISHKNLKHLKQDVTKPYLLFCIKKIYHLACHASPPKYQKDPIHTMETCFQGTLNMLKLAEINKCPMLFTSTSEVYGEPLENPQKETYRGNVSCNGPRSCYDEGKRIAESLCYEFQKKGVDVKVCRIFNTYGPYMSPDDGRVVTNFIHNDIIKIYGNGEQTRSFMYIDDLIDGIYKLMDSKEKGPINLGNPCEITINQLKDIIGKDKIVEYVEAREDDPTQRRPDISLAKEKLGWEPKISLKEGLGRLLQSSPQCRHCHCIL